MTGAKPPVSAEGRLTHDSVARINVEPGKGAVTLRLWQWSLSPEAVMTLREAELLISKLRAGIDRASGKKPAPTRPTLSDDDDDIA